MKRLDDFWYQGRRVELFEIESLVELKKELTYLEIRGGINEAIREFFMEFGYLPYQGYIYEDGNKNGMKRIFMPVREGGRYG